MLRAESSVEWLPRAFPVLTGCLPAGRQGWEASITIRPGGEDGDEK
jgi:hypothetical protein